jgi:hypothetical protein
LLANSIVDSLESCLCPRHDGYLGSVVLEDNPTKAERSSLLVVLRLNG